MFLNNMLKKFRNPLLFISLVGLIEVMNTLLTVAHYHRTVCFDVALYYCSLLLFLLLGALVSFRKRVVCDAERKYRRYGLVFFILYMVIRLQIFWGSLAVSTIHLSNAIFRASIPFGWAPLSSEMTGMILFFLSYYTVELVQSLKSGSQEN